MWLINLSVRFRKMRNLRFGEGVVLVALLVTMTWVMVISRPLFSQPSSDSSSQLQKILENISRRLEAYPDFEKWKALVTSTYVNADKNWQPEKIRRVKKLLTVNGEIREEEILEAVEIEKGRTRDITEEYRKQRLERLRRQKEEAEKAQPAGEKPSARNQLTKDDLVPFTPRNRPNYVFKLVGEGQLNGLPVFIIEARARQKKEYLFEGLYYISQQTYDPLRLVLKPSRNPNFVREFELEIELEPWQDQLVLKKSRIKVYGGFLFKSVRMVIEEDYTDFKLIV